MVVCWFAKRDNLFNIVKIPFGLKILFFEKLLEDGTLSNIRIIWTFKISMNFYFVVRVSFRQDTVYILNYYAEYIFFTMFWFLKTFQFRKYKQFCPEIEWNPDQKNGWDHRFRIFIRKENGFITFISRFTLSSRFYSFSIIFEYESMIGFIFLEHWHNSNDTFEKLFKNISNSTSNLYNV